MTTRILGPLAILGILFLATLAAAEDGHYAPTDGWPSPLGWNEYGGSLERTGRSPATGPTAPKEAAKAELGARSFSAPVLDRAGHVFVGDTSGKVHRYTPELEKVWTSPVLGGPLRSSVLLGPDGTVYAAPVAKDLVALDGQTGKILWRAPIHNTAPSSEYVLTGAPAWHPDGFIVQGSMDGKVYAVTPEGKAKWSFQTHTDVDNKVVATATVAGDGTIYIGSQNGRLYALTPEGKERWAYRTSELTSRLCPEEQQVAAPSLADDGTIYVGTRLKGCGSSGKVYALTDGETRATLKWSRNLADKVTAPATVGMDGTVYIGALDGTFYALSPTDGAIRWTFRPQDDDPTLRSAIGVSVSLSAAELAVVDAQGRLYVPFWNVDMTKGFPPQDSLSSPFYALDDQGKIVWRKIFPNTMRSPALMPTVSGSGLLYVAGDDARLYALGTEPPVPPAIPDDLEVPEPLPETGGSDPAASPAEGEDRKSPAPFALIVLFALLAAGAARRRA